VVDFGTIGVDLANVMSLYCIVLSAVACHKTHVYANSAVWCLAKSVFEVLVLFTGV
jgi:hypothetical protein